MKKLFGILAFLPFFVMLNCTSDESNVNENIEQNKNISLIQRNRGDLSEFDLTNENILNTEYGSLVYYNSFFDDNKFLFKDQNNSFSQITIQPNGKFNYYNFDSELELNFESEFDDDLGYEVVDLTSYKVDSHSSECNCESILALDMGICLISAAAIAASDGPLPFADAAAISYGVACGVRASLAHEDCVAACLNN